MLEKTGVTSAQGRSFRPSVFHFPVGFPHPLATSSIFWPCKRRAAVFAFCNAPFLPNSMVCFIPLPAVTIFRQPCFYTLAITFHNANNPVIYPKTLRVFLDPPNSAAAIYGLSCCRYNNPSASCKYNRPYRYHNTQLQAHM